MKIIRKHTSIVHVPKRKVLGDSAKKKKKKCGLAFGRTHIVLRGSQTKMLLRKERGCGSAIVPPVGMWMVLIVGLTSIAVAT